MVGAVDYEKQCLSTTAGSWTSAKWRATASAKRSAISTPVTHVTATGSVNGFAIPAKREASVSGRTSPSRSLDWRSRVGWGRNIIRKAGYEG